jgi:hypothetical protein
MAADHVCSPEYLVRLSIQISYPRSFMDITPKLQLSAFVPSSTGVRPFIQSFKQATINRALDLQCQPKLEALYERLYTYAFYICSFQIDSYSLTNRWNIPLTATNRPPQARNTPLLYASPSFTNAKLTTTNMFNGILKTP